RAADRARTRGQGAAVNTDCHIGEQVIQLGALVETKEAYQAQHDQVHRLKGEKKELKAELKTANATITQQARKIKKLEDELKAYKDAEAGSDDEDDGGHAAFLLQAEQRELRQPQDRLAVFEAAVIQEIRGINARLHEMAQQVQGGGPRRNRGWLRGWFRNEPY
ncbi:hypothetical protein OC844_007524, partial [Tilletia horrida]